MVSFCISAILLLQASAEAFQVRTAPSTSSRLFPRHHHQHTPPLSSPKINDMARLVTSRLSTRLFESATTSPEKMKASEIRKELESYGISTKSFLEKKELVEALQKARAEGLKPVEETTKTESKTENEEQSASKGGAGSKSRKERIDEEKEKAKSKKVGELKKELQDMGISTKSFFEKTEFVQAFAEAMVDGPPKAKVGTRRQTSSPQEAEEKFDPSYRDVVMQKFDPRLLGRSPIIDVSLGR